MMRLLALDDAWVIRFVFARTRMKDVFVAKWKLRARLLDYAIGGIPNQSTSEEGLADATSI